MSHKHHQEGAIPLPATTVIESVGMTLPCHGSRPGSIPGITAIFGPVVQWQHRGLSSHWPRIVTEQGYHLAVIGYWQSDSLPSYRRGFDSL